MSNVEKFEELLRSSEELQARLRAATEAYEGDKADERAVFDAVVAPLAAEAGLPFTYEEGAEYAASGKGLSDAELDAVAGGGAFCFILGVGERVDACVTEYLGANACEVVGVGLLANN